MNWMYETSISAINGIYRMNSFYQQGRTFVWVCNRKVTVMDRVLFGEIHVLIACELTALIRIQDNRFCYHKRLFKAVMTILVSRVSSTSQPTIQRLYQSITAVRYRNPRLMGMYVMSIDHAWFGRSIMAFRSRYGQTLACCIRLERFIFG